MLKKCKEKFNLIDNINDFFEKREKNFISNCNKKILPPIFILKKNFSFNKKNNNIIKNNNKNNNNKNNKKNIKINISFTHNNSHSNFINNNNINNNIENKIFLTKNNLIKEKKQKISLINECLINFKKNYIKNIIKNKTNSNQNLLENQNKEMNNHNKIIDSIIIQFNKSKNYLNYLNSYLKYLKNYKQNQIFLNEKLILTIFLTKYENNKIKNKIKLKEKEILNIKKWINLLLSIKTKTSINHFENNNNINIIINKNAEKFNLIKLNEIIYKTFEDFLKNFIYFPFDCLNLLQKLDRLKSDNFKLKNNLISFKTKLNENKYLDNIYNMNLNKKIFLKNLNKSLINEKKYYIQFLKKNRKKYFTNIFSKITKKITHIYKFIKAHESSISIENFCLSKNCSNLEMLKYIESYVNFLLIDNNELKKNNNNLNKKIFENVENLKEKEEKKEIKKDKYYYYFLRKKYENQKKKIYFIPKKKVDYAYSFNMKKLLNKNNNSNINNKTLLKTNYLNLKTNNSFDNKNIDYYKEFSLYDL